MGLSMLELINSLLENKILTRKEFKRIRNHGTIEELEEAVKAMIEAGGYENLED